MKFKPNIRQLLLNKSAAEGRQIEQKEVAEATGLPPMTISRWMNSDGFLRIEAETTFKFAEYFGVTIDEVVSIIEDSENPENETRSTPNAA